MMLKLRVYSILITPYNVTHTVSTSVAQLHSLIRKQMSLELPSVDTVCQFWCIWQLSSIVYHWIRWRDRDLSVWYSSDKRSKGQAATFWRNRHLWSSFSSFSESESATVIGNSTCTILEYFHFLLHRENTSIIITDSLLHTKMKQKLNKTMM